VEVEKSRELSETFTKKKKRRRKEIVIPSSRIGFFQLKNLVEHYHRQRRKPLLPLPLPPVMTITYASFTTEMLFVEIICMKALIILI